MGREFIVTWYFTKRPQTEYHIFVPIKVKDPLHYSAERIKKQYCCKDEDFNILSVQEGYYGKL